VKIATGLTLIAIGAVLAFAVHGHPWFLNLQVVGWIIMIIGAIGLAIPRTGYGWLRRQMVVRRTVSGQPVGVRQGRAPSYVMLDPAPAAADPGTSGPPVEQVETTETEGPATARMPVTPIANAAGQKAWASGDDVIAGNKVVPDEEVVEEYFPEP
jgi:hypothetical protein